MSKNISLLYLYHQVEKSGKNLIIATRNDQEAWDLYSELKEFVPSELYDLLIFPSRGIPPFEDSFPHPSISLQRIKTLMALSKQPEKNKILVIPISEILWFVLEKNEIRETAVTLTAGITYRRDFLIRKLLNYGYEFTDRVENHGEMSFRGSIIDFLPPDEDNIIRIDYFGDEIEVIKQIDPEEYTTKSLLESIEILPVRESFIADKSREVFEQKIKLLSRQRKIDKHIMFTTLENFESELSFPYMEFALNLIHTVSPILHYLSIEKSIFFSTNNVEKEITKEYEIIEKHYREAREHFPFLPKLDEMIMLPSELLKLLPPSINEHPLNWEAITGRIFPFTDDPQKSKLVLDQKRREGYKITFFTKTNIEKEKIEELLQLTLIATDIERIYEETPGFYEIRAGVIKGYPSVEDKILFIGRGDWQELRKRALKKIRRGKRKIELTLRDIKEGDYVVHEDHGIALYQGLKTFPGEGDFVTLKFANGKVYVPIFKLDKISPYIGEDEPELSELGTSQWKKLKEKVKESVEQLAVELLKLYAEREVKEGTKYSPPGSLYRAIEESFPFDETTDQERAIEETISDMMEPKPMDRLICGDAGFGKTEVAVRAAIKAIEDGKQVVLMAPTTVLSLQHFQVFKDRLNNLPVRVELLNRLIKKEEQKKIVAEVAAGKVDILIGTHRLLSRDIKFKNLGLIIIDEEQKFGVKQKEKLRKLKSTVDTLVLTATPIPRTLHTTLTGLRQVSVITTPPKERKEVETHIIGWEPEKIKKGIDRELERGGQIFFIYNRIEGLKEIFEKVKALTPPGAKITYAHGRMPPEELEEKILAFYRGEYDIFVSTTIIESGVDIPRANTIFIVNAHMFGLAELYQLRGRVGRSHIKGYAYLIIPQNVKLTSKAKKRLQILKSFSQLGSGFKIAIKDLELRGAGELLGKKQHGFMNKLGYDLYMKMLQRAIKQQKGGRTVSEELELRLGIPAMIPENYISDIEERLDFYYRLSTASDKEEIKQIVDEMIEIYGELPEEVRKLRELYYLKNSLQQAGVKEAQITEEFIRVFPSSESSLSTEKIIEMMQQAHIKVTQRYIQWDKEPGEKEEKLLQRVTTDLLNLIQDEKNRK